jgi:hypothetical protein
LIIMAGEIVVFALAILIWLLLMGEFQLWPLVIAAAAVGAGSLAALIVLTGIEARKVAREERERLMVELGEALNGAKTMRGLIPICASCKKVRDDQGEWHQVEQYVHQHSEAEFTHGICPDCVQRLYASGVLEDRARLNPPYRIPSKK